MIRTGRTLAALLALIFATSGARVAVAQTPTPPPTPPAAPAKPATKPAKTEPAKKPEAAKKAEPTKKAEPAKKAAPAKTAQPAKPSRPELPTPPTPPEEAAFRARLDTLLAPLKARPLTPEDATRLKTLTKASANGEGGQAKTLREQLTDPVGQKLALWHALRSGVGEPADFLAFSEANPAWPGHHLLRRRAEEQLLAAGGSAARIMAFFKDREPATGMGWTALASAHLAAGDTAKATAIARRVWRDKELPILLEAGFLDRFGTLLGPDDHRRRLDRILVDSIRSAAERRARADIARRVIPLLAEAERPKAEARLAVFLRAKLAGQLLAALPVEPKDQRDWGLAFQRVQHLRRADKDAEAWEILAAAPTDPDIITSPDDWWVERRAAAFDALKAGKTQVAYDLVKDAGPLTVNPLKEQAFLAGWLALRYLRKPDLALTHFTASRTAADGPLSRARADYWAGRALEALQRRDEARRRYTAAAVERDTFHGALARHKIDGAGPLAMPVALPAMPTPEEVARFLALDAVQAAVVAKQAGLDRSILQALFGHLRNHLKSEGEMVLLAHLAEILGDPQTSLRVGKAAIARGLNLYIYAYPLAAFPAYAPLRDPPETAMLLAIARQESEFNNTIISSAGARGLLQVMPITARHVCTDHKITCTIPRLLTDNGYNAAIASAYIGDRMAEFRGSYVLTLVGYNAGPGRARQWIRELGDPRDPAVDVVDWMERIPIEETREYVKKVLSNIQMYRARLGEAKPLRLEQDILRARAPRAAPKPVEQAPDAAKK